MNDTRFPGRDSVPNRGLEQLFALPAHLLDGVQRLVTQQPPPAGVMAELENRVCLLVNHILSQEAEAIVVGGVSVTWRVTLVGLFESTTASPSSSEPDLRIDVTQAQWSALLKTLVSGEQPEVQIFGDVMLAAELGWLREHVRWDVEADIARLVGDVPAVWLSSAGKQLVAAVQRFGGKAAA
jgi:ubiquinone biosynthesis protein UbiJ